ncbi:SufB Cysteine desulfurase activator SufB [Candidatus Nanopelagicaceae bacterium]
MTTLQSNLLENHTPTGREEAWRFTPLKRLAGLHDGSAKPEARNSLTLNGTAQSGVSFTRGAVTAASVSEDAIVNRIRNYTSEGAILAIDKNTVVEAPIFLNRCCGGVDTAELSRVQIRLGEHAKATVILENTGDTHLAEDLEIILAPGSDLTFISLQEWSAKTVYAATHNAIIDRDATFKAIHVTVGGDVVRILPKVEFVGPGASADLQGIYFATAGQFFEHRMHVDHAVPHAKSNVNYKGALAGDKAHTVWIGDVYIRAAAEGTDTYELNRNLLLTDGARADSVPNLEIETGEIVGAGHASTTGRFDDEQLFYLMSRGIEEADARRLVVRGFFNEVISLIGNEEIQERLMTRIDDELEKAGK